MLMIANKAYHPEAGYNYKGFSPHQSLSSPSIRRRHSFSSFEQATYKKPTSVNTTSAFSKPSLSQKVVISLAGRAFALGYNTSDLMITYEFTKKALEALSLPPLQLQTSLVSEEISTHPHFEWSLIPCRIIKTNLGKIVVTEDHAINICDPSKEEKYYSKLQNEEKIIGRVNPSNQEIGLTQEKITHLGGKTFYLHEHAKSPREFYPFDGFSHMTEAHLEDCSRIKFSSKEELLTAASYLIHQVDILHKAKICHMDIKAENICKTKDGKFKVIDRYGSLDFTRKETLERVTAGKIDTTSWMIPRSLITELLNAKTSEEAKKTATAADIFATGCTLYRMTYAFTHYIALKEYSDKASLPYSIDADQYPYQLLSPKTLDQTLLILTPQQQDMIKKTLSRDPQPSLNALKAAFPLPTKNA